MLESSLRDVYLVDELQLGERLNSDLHADDRADFALLLSMLSQDILDQPLSFKPGIDHVEIADYREHFRLLPEQRKYAEHDDFERADQLSTTFADEGHRGVFLAECLREEPLVPVRHDLDPDVMNQFSPLKREKIIRFFQGQRVDQQAALQERGDGFGIVEEIDGSQRLHAVV